MPGRPVTLPYHTDKKELGKTFLMYKEIQEGSGAMKKGFLERRNARVQRWAVRANKFRKLAILPNNLLGADVMSG
jgi:hypothetical protein